MFMLLKRSNLLFWHRNVLGSAELLQSDLGIGNLDVHLSRQGKGIGKKKTSKVFFTQGI